MDLNLRDKVVVVTGGSMGIGRAIVEEFLKEGAKVITCGRREEPLKKMKEEIREAGFDVDYEVCDVSDLPAVQNYLNIIMEKYGRIDVWVNNAGINILKMFMEYTPEEYDKIMNVNLKAVFFCTQAVAEKMKQTGGGVIINATSFNSQIAHANGIIYAMSKAGVTSFCRAAASSLAPYGIRIVNYLPGLISTPLAEELIHSNPEKYIKDVSLARPGRTEEVAKPVVFLASDQASYISGVDVEITGGKFSVQDCSMPWRYEAEKASK